MSYDDKIASLVNYIYSNICPKPQEGKRYIPILKGLVVCGDPKIDSWIEIVIKDFPGYDISDPIRIPKEILKSDKDQIALHSKYFKYNIISASMAGVLDWKTIDVSDTTIHSTYDGIGERIILNPKDS